jgi:hypothetical protein
MTWAEYVAAVNVELGVDGTRRGIDALRLRATRDAVIDLQRYIRQYRQGHTTTYQEADLTAKNYAHAGTLPAGAVAKAFYIVSTGDTVEEGTTDNPDCVRNRLDFCAWDQRQALLICNQYGSRDYFYTISPHARTFLVHPLVNDETYLLLVWDGLKMDFENADVVPFPEHSAEAAAAYVKYRILLEVDRRPDLAREWWDKRTGTGIYPSLRLALARDAREAQDADNQDEEYGATAVAPTAPPA